MRPYSANDFLNSVETIAVFPFMVLWSSVIGIVPFEVLLIGMALSDVFPKLDKDRRIASFPSHGRLA